MFFYERYKELQDLAVKDFYIEEERKFFYLLEEAPLNINILDKEYLKENYKDGYYNYHVAITSNMNTFLVNVLQKEELDVYALIERLIQMYIDYFSYSKKEIMKDLIERKTELNITTNEILKLYDDINNFYEFVENSKIDLSGLIQYFN